MVEKHAKILFGMDNVDVEKRVTSFWSTVGLPANIMQLPLAAVIKNDYNSHTRLNKFAVIFEKDPEFATKQVIKMLG